MHASGTKQKAGVTTLLVEDSVTVLDAIMVYMQAGELSKPRRISSSLKGWLIWLEVLLGLLVLLWMLGCAQMTCR